MSDYITWVQDNQVHLAESDEVLLDPKYPWRERKMKTVQLADLYQIAGYDAYAERARTCATWLQYRVDAEGARQLAAVNFCQLRLCPMCIGRRAKKAAYTLSRVLDAAEQQHECLYLFLTLTVRSMPGSELGQALTDLTAAWRRLIDHRRFEKSVLGWFRAIEITRGDKGYHPHIHAILAVPPAYFRRGAGLYISQSEWIDRWQAALRCDYKPSVRIQVAKAKGEYSGERAAAAEAAKYAVKDADYIDPKLSKRKAAQILQDYTTALHHRRLTAFGGILKDAAAALNADIDDGDLVHIDEDAIRDDLVQMVETYHWHFGAGDYILSERHFA